MKKTISTGIAISILALSLALATSCGLLPINNFIDKTEGGGIKLTMIVPDYNHDMESGAITPKVIAPQTRAALPASDCSCT